MSGEGIPGTAIHVRGSSQPPADVPIAAMGFAHEVLVRLDIVGNGVFCPESRFNPDEQKEKLTAAAKKAGLDLSGWVRSLALREASNAGS